LRPNMVAARHRVEIGKALRLRGMSEKSINKSQVTAWSYRADDVATARLLSAAGA
jgi:hypothetical protein